MNDTFVARESGERLCKRELTSFVKDKGDRCFRSEPAAVVHVKRVMRLESVQLTFIGGVGCDHPIASSTI